jgi:N-carbamoyl-L-amino-acid hydrolase
MHDDLHRLIAAFSAIGATEAGGVCRLAGTPEDGEARRLFAREARRRGADLVVDPIGNMFATFPLAHGSDDTVLTGSHLDSQPTGGRYDGAYGVLAALAAASDIARNPPRGARHNLTVVNWTNEEGARYQPSLTGSSVHVGALPLADALALEDRAGTSLGAALGAIGFCGDRPFPLRPVRYIELHVEQGDRLETEGVPIGVVTGVWAVRKMTVAFLGEASHTGPTPMPRRRDALRAAALAITLLYDRVEQAGLGLHASASQITIHPQSPNVVPSLVRVWFEVRHPELEIATRVADAFLEDVRLRVAPRGVDVRVDADEKRANIFLDPRGAEIVREAAAAVGKPSLDLMTIAGHDAVILQKKVPSTLVFVPSAGGLSHNEKEYTAPEDLENGLQVLRETLVRMLAEG